MLAFKGQKRIRVDANLNEPETFRTRLLLLAPHLDHSSAGTSAGGGGGGAGMKAEADGAEEAAIKHREGRASPETCTCCARVQGQTPPQRRIWRHLGRAGQLLLY